MQCCAGFTHIIDVLLVTTRRRNRAQLTVAVNQHCHSIISIGCDVTDTGDKSFIVCGSITYTNRVTFTRYPIIANHNIVAAGGV